MRENEKEREELKASSLKTLLMSKKKGSVTVMAGTFILSPSQAKLQKSLN